MKGLNEFINEFDSSKNNIVFTIGSNPVNSSIYSNQIKEKLINANFVVSLDLFKNETTELANIILPTTSFGEKEGTFTNLEMRTLKQNKILPTPGSVLNEWEYWSMMLNKIDIENNYESEFELNLQLCEEYLDKDNVPSFDNLNKPSNLDGVLNSKSINIKIENVEPGPLEIIFVNRLYGDSSTQINSPSISMLGAERFIEMNNDTFIKNNLSSYTVNLVQGVSTLQVKIKINNHLPNELIIAPLNRRGFRDIDTTMPYELIEVKNLEQLSVN